MPGMLPAESSGSTIPPSALESGLGLSAEELRDAWALLTVDERLQGFTLLAESEVEEFFLGLSSAEQAKLLLAMPLAERRPWMRLLIKDAVADVVQSVTEAGSSVLLEALDETTRRDVNALLLLGTPGETTPLAQEPQELPQRAEPDFGVSDPSVLHGDDPSCDGSGLFEVPLPEAAEGEPAHPELAALVEDEEEGEDEGAEHSESGDGTSVGAGDGALARAPLSAGEGAEFEVYKTIGSELVPAEATDSGVWINLVNPSHEVMKLLSQRLDVEIDLLKAALDEEERPRIEVENGTTLIIVDLPALAKDGARDFYTTVPLGIVLTPHCVVTVCLRRDTLLEEFTSGRVKGFVTQYRTRFILQILHRAATRYLQYLRSIDRASSRIEQELQSSMKNKELIQLLKLEKSLVYFSTSLKSNELVLEKLTRLEKVRSYPEDRDLLEDVIIENKQALEMANIYSNILSGTMDAFASIISNNLNMVMKVLTSVTIVMAIPTMVSSFFGMNVALPLDGPRSFIFILLGSLVLCMAAILVLWRGKML